MQNDTAVPNAYVKYAFKYATVEIHDVLIKFLLRKLVTEYAERNICERGKGRPSKLHYAKTVYRGYDLTRRVLVAVDLRLNLSSSSIGFSEQPFLKILASIPPSCCGLLYFLESHHCRQARSNEEGLLLKTDNCPAGTRRLYT